MAVFRIDKTRDYTVMSNHHLRNTALSLKAKGLLSLMLSLPDSWDYTTKGLAAVCKDGIDSICSTIKELEQHGYITETIKDSLQRLNIPFWSSLKRFRLNRKNLNGKILSWITQSWENLNRVVLNRKTPHN